MDYIINVRAELNSDSETKLRAKFENIKSDLEQTKIKIGYEPDDKFDISSIKKQIENEKITLKVSNVVIDKGKIAETAKATAQTLDKALTNSGVTKYLEKTKEQVVGLTENYSKLYNLIQQSSKIEMPNIKHGVKVRQEKDENGKDVWVQAESVKYTKEQIMQIQKQIQLLKQQFKDFGTVSVDEVYDAQQQLKSFVLTIKDGNKELGKLRYTLDNKLIGQAKSVQDGIGTKVATPILSMTGYSLNENAIARAEQESKAVEKANKLYAQHTDILNKATAAARELWAVQSDRKNPIENVEMGITEGNGITTLSSDLDKLTPKTKEFVESYNEWVVAIRKANNELETQRSISNNTLNELTKARLATQTASKNAIAERTTATDYRTKDVTAEIEKAKEELKLFESKIAKIGLSLKDLVGDSGETLRDMLDNVSDSEGFAKYLDQLGIAKARFKNLEDEIKTDAKAMQDYKKSMQDLISLNEKIASQEKKIIDAEYAGKPPETIQLLKDELDDLQITYSKLVTNFVNNPLFESLVGEDLNELDKSVARIEQVAESRKAEKSQRHDEKLKKEYYQEQLKVQNEIDKLIAEQNKLSADADNIHQRELVSIVQKLKILEQQKDELDALAKANLSEESYLENQNQLLQAGNEKLEERKRLRSQIYDSVESKANSTYDSFVESINKEHFDKNLGANGKSAITSDIDKINQLKNAYQEVVDTLDALKSSTTNQQLKDNTEAVEEAIKKYNDLASAIKNVDSIGSDLSKLKTQTDKGLFVQNSDNQKVIELKNEIQDIASEYEKLNGIFQSEGMSIKLSQEFQALSNRIKNASTDAGVLRKELQETKTAASLLDKKNALSNKIEMWLKNNTKASESMKRSMRELQNQIESADGAKLTGLRQEFKRLNNIAHETNQIGKSAVDTFKEKLGKFTGWFGLANMVMSVTNSVKQAIVELEEVDTTLTEISKTSDMTEQELKELGNTAFESASQYGVVVQSFLTGVQEMSRAGYGAASESMAELSILAQSAGDMTAQVANDYLIATDAAYQFKGSQEELSKVLDGQNLISNRYAVSLTDMAEATKEAASTASEYGVSIEQLSALITMAVSKTRQTGSEAGTAINALMLNLTDITNKERMKAFDDLGVSVYKFTNGVKQVKTPIELLDELSGVLKSLPEGDDRINELFNDIGGRVAYHYVQKCA